MLPRNTPYTFASNLERISTVNAKESFDTPRIVREKDITEFYHCEIFLESSRHVNRWFKIRKDLVSSSIKTNDIANCGVSHEERLLSHQKKRRKAYMSHTFSLGERGAFYLSPKRFEMSDESNDTFLFTSESVGEGHPGKLQLQGFTKTFIVLSIFFFKSPCAFEVADLKRKFISSSQNEITLCLRR